MNRGDATKYQDLQFVTSLESLFVTEETDLSDLILGSL